MSAAVSKSAFVDPEREELRLRLSTMQDMDHILTREIKRLQERLRALAGLPPKPEVSVMAAEPPQAAAGGFNGEGKPLKEAASTGILNILAKGHQERLKAEAAAKAAAEAKKTLPPWHGQPFASPRLRQPASSANAEATARIAARMAEELANLVARFVAWMKNPPPFATSPESTERRATASSSPSMEPGWGM